MGFYGAQLPNTTPFWSYPYLNSGTNNQWIVDVTLPIVINIKDDNKKLPPARIFLGLFAV
jgi:hypothetical protein